MVDLRVQAVDLAGLSDTRQGVHRLARVAVVDPSGPGRRPLPAVRPYHPSATVVAVGQGAPPWSKYFIKVASFTRIGAASRLWWA